MSMSVASININVDSEIKDRAQEVFTSLGLDMSTAVNIFLRQAIRQQGIPFDSTVEPVMKRSKQGGGANKIHGANN
jgi:DNA-damage-inducible protein J